jgi:glycosyltransferase involved in cell wall biosynthesis
VDLDSLAFDADGAMLWRAELGIRSDEFLILSMGRLHHKKGLDLLPNAISPLRALPWRLVIVGDDEDGTRERLVCAIRSGGVSDRICLIGAVSPRTISRIYSAADLFVLPSRHENFGNVVVEAMACGTPVMITPEVGLSEEVSRAGAGYVVRRDAQEWSGMLKRAISQPSELAAARKQALALSRTFSREMVASQMAREYEITLDEARSQRRT